MGDGTCYARPVTVSRIACALMLLAVMPPLPATAQPSARMPIDIAKLGPQVGQQVPDFSLKDQNGKTWTRQGILGPNGAMLVFFRSADW